MNIFKYIFNVIDKTSVDSYFFQFWFSKLYNKDIQYFQYTYKNKHFEENFYLNFLTRQYSIKWRERQAATRQAKIYGMQ